MLKIINIFKDSSYLNHTKKYEKKFFQNELINKVDKNFEVHYINKEKTIDLSKEIYDIGSKGDHLIVIKDNQILLDNNQDDLYQCVFICDIDFNGLESDAFITKQISNCIKKFIFINSLFEDANNIELLRLPFLNFNSTHLRKLILIHKKSSSEDFQEQFSQCLKKIKCTHRKPKKRSADKKKFFVDENEMYFELGKELHSRHETGLGHNCLCDFKAHFRFGCKIDEMRHYNASLDKNRSSLISGDFSDCHKNKNRFVNKTHLNIFSNDYIA